MAFVFLCKRFHENYFLKATLAQIYRYASSFKRAGIAKIVLLTGREFITKRGVEKGMGVSQR
ncbi:MAG: hypothetical protein E7H57_02510 [Pantoea sp.]|nr:hypothetical protein [Pantoea sp.]